MYKSKNPELSRKLLCTISRMTNNVVVVLPQTGSQKSNTSGHLARRLSCLRGPLHLVSTRFTFVCGSHPHDPTHDGFATRGRALFAASQNRWQEYRLHIPRFFPDGDLRTRRGGRGIFRRRTRTHRRARYQLIVCGWQRPDHYHRPRCASRGVRRGDLHAGIPRHR